MFLKITAIVIVTFVAASQGEKVWDGYSAKWSGNISDGSGYYQLPQTLSAAKSEGWTEISGVNAPHGLLPLGYFGDPRVVLLFSNCTGKVTGHQVGLKVVDIESSGVPINYTANPAFTKKNLNGDDYFTATALFKEDAKGNRRIWLEKYGKFEEIPTKSKLVLSETPYYSKRCTEWMGHHFYQLNSTTDAACIFPWFLLDMGGNIIGVGFQALGNTTSAPQRTWFETIPQTQLAETIPDISDEIGTVVADNGLSSLHFWFRKDPVAIGCSDECTAVYNGTGEYNHHRSTRRRRATGSGNVC